MNNDLVTKLFKKYHIEEHERWKKFSLDVSYEEVADAILKLTDRKNPGPLGAPTIFLKRNYIYFTYLFTDIFNMIMKEGILPEDWREAFLIPIFKKGDTTNAGIEEWRSHRRSQNVMTV